MPASPAPITMQFPPATIQTRTVFGLGTLVAAAALAGALPSAATHLAAQELERPSGWQIRFDDPSATEAQLEAFVSMPPGWHVTSGPAAIYWEPGMRASGDFRAEMEVFLFDPGSRREAFGLFVGGHDLDGPGQAYTYFLLRNGGEYIIKRREGDAAPTIRPWTRDDAVVSYADRGDDVSVKNVLAIEARGPDVRFFINDHEVAVLPRSSVGVDGTYGFRVNHGLNLHISRLEAVAIR